jgi:hypothetical protein
MATKKTKAKSRIVYHDVWVVFSLVDGNRGEIMGCYDSEEEALDDCWGPYFRDFRIVRYARRPGFRPLGLRDGIGRPKGG